MIRWIIDGILVLILIAACWRGGRAGFIPGMFMLIGLFVAIYGANLVAETYSEEFTSMLEPFVSGLTDRASRAAEAEFDELNIKPDTEAATRKTLNNMGIIDSAADNISETICNETNATGHELKSLLVEKLCSCAAYLLTLLVAFILIAVIFAVLNNLINLSFHMPGFEFVNGILGACFGLAQGLVILFVILWFLRFAGLLIDKELMDSTLVLKKLMEINPLPGILRL